MERTSPAEEGGMKCICLSLLKVMQLTSATQRKPHSYSSAGLIIFFQ